MEKDGITARPKLNTGGETMWISPRVFVWLLIVLAITLLKPTQVTITFK
jgi:hypothetical protein